MKSTILVRYHLHSLWNWRSAYLGRFIEPIAYLLFLTAGLNSLISDQGPGYPRFAFLGILCFVAFRSATATVADVSNDRKWGIVAIYTMQGGRIGGYLLSIVLFSALVFLGQIVILMAVGFVVFGPDALGGWSLVGSTVIALLVVVGWVGFGAAVAARVQSYAVRDLVITVAALPLVLSAPIFYSLDRAPGYLRVVAALNPLTYQAGWLRSSGLDLWGATAAAGLWSIAGIIVAAIAITRADSLSRER